LNQGQRRSGLKPLIRDARLGLVVLWLIKSRNNALLSNIFDQADNRWRTIGEVNGVGERSTPSVGTWEVVFDRMEKDQVLTSVERDVLSMRRKCWKRQSGKQHGNISGAQAAVLR